MKILESHESFFFVGSGELRSDSTQTGKPHLTEIMRALEREMGWNYKGKGFEDKWLTMETGFIWEETLSVVLGDRCQAVRPGEVERDGIVGSPDGVGPDPGVLDERETHIIKPSDDLVLEEYKCTWRSSRHSIEKNWNYMTQAKSYCAMLDLTVVVFRILYLMGDYRGSGPQYKVFRIEFDQEELDDNWNMIVDFAKEKGFLK